MFLVVYMYNVVLLYHTKGQYFILRSIIFFMYVYLFISVVNLFILSGREMIEHYFHIKYNILNRSKIVLPPCFAHMESTHSNMMCGGDSITMLQKTYVYVFHTYVAFW